MGRRAEIFKLLASEDINGDKMNFSMAVFSGLGCAHFNNLAWATFDNDETVLTKRRALHGIGSRGASIGALEGMLMLLNCVS